MKDQFQNFQYKVKQYLLQESDNPRGVIIVVWYIKDPYAHFYMDNPAKISKEDK